VRILIASTFTPFASNADLRVADTLRRELIRRGYNCDTALLPFSDRWSDYASQTTALRLIDVTESCGNRIDRLITIRTPAHALRHPHKVAWFLDHNRTYDRLDARPLRNSDALNDRHGRDMMRYSDELYLTECRHIYSGSFALANRLQDFNGIHHDAVLYPPLREDHPFRPGPFGDYFLVAGRTDPNGRANFLSDALAHTDPQVKLVVANRDASDGVPGARTPTVSGRIRYIGATSEEERAEWTAGCCGIIVLVQNLECHGAEIFEAFQSAKPILALGSCNGDASLVGHNENGFICSPTPESLGHAMTAFWQNREAGEALGRAGRACLTRKGIHWDRVIGKLLA